MTDSHVRTAEQERHILLVDDDVDFVESLVDLLEPHGYVIATAHSASAAIERARATASEVALVDVRLGARNGIQLISDLRAARPGLLCVVMTAFADVQTAVQAIQEGAYDYLRKPMDARSVFATLHRCFERIDLERRKTDAESALERSEWRYRTLARVAPVGIGHLDTEGKCLSVNQTWLELTGIDPEATLGQSYLDMVHRDDAKTVDEQWNRCLRERRPFHEEYRLVRPDGSEIWVMGQAVPETDSQGAVTGFVATLTDITERKRVEEALRQTTGTLNSILASATEYAIVATDLDFRVVHFNPAAAQLFHHDPSELSGRDIRLTNVLTGVSPALFDSAIDAVLRDGIWEYEYEQGAGVARKRVVRITMMPMCDGEGTCQGYTLFAQDITRHRELEDQLRQAQKMEAVGTLASGIAHDFNNLLTAIYGYTELAKSTLPENHPAVEALNMVEQASQQASGVTRSLLTFSRKGRSHKEPLDLGRTIEEAIRLLRHMLPASVHLVRELPRDESIWIRGDVMQIQQVVMNLAVNARDAMPEGGQLRIALSVEDPAAGRPSLGGERGAESRAKLIVEDTGMGMQEEVQARIFEPFFTTKPREQGTGLGMAIIHGIITDHNGTVDVESEVGRGTRVTITLPCCPPAEAEATNTAERARFSGRGETILVVEDDDQVRAIVASSLKSHGYTAIQAVDAIEANERLAANGGRVRLIVLDLDLPHKSGGVWLREVRESGYHLPVIVTSGNTRDLDAASEDENRYVLSKPFQMSELAALVSRLLSETQSPVGE